MLLPIKSTYISSRIKQYGCIFYFNCSKCKKKPIWAFLNVLGKLIISYKGGHAPIRRAYGNLMLRSYPNPFGQCRNSPTLPPQMLTGAPLMVIYKKTFSTLCYIPNGLQNKKSSLQTHF